MNIENYELLDKISEISIENGTLVSQMKIPENSSILDAHFKGSPIMPGALLIEIMAQSSGNLILAKMEFNKMAVLASVSYCKFVDFSVPGDKLECSIQLLKFNSEFAVSQAQITRDGGLIAKAELRMKVLDFFSEITQKNIIDNYNQMIGSY
jgi:3-hydroxyacyl-[acyl-carrier-protein] dehydratase